MMKLKKNWMISAAALAAIALATPSFAEEAPVIPSFKLITVSPGGELMTAFGHAAVEMDPDSNPETPDSIVYEFGRPLIGSILSQLTTNPRQVVTLLRLIVNENVPVLVQFRPAHLFYAGQSAAMNEEQRSSRQDALILSPEEALALKAAFEREFPTVGGGPNTRRLTSVRKYYRNFDSNCATWIRDLLMTASPELQAAWSAPGAGPLTLEAVLTEAFDYAVASRPQSAPYINWYEGGSSEVLTAMLTMMEMPVRIHNGAEFVTAMNKMNDQVQLPPESSFLYQLMSGAGVERALVAIRPTFTAYVDRIQNQQLVTQKDRIFLPVKLREALIAVGKISAN